MDRTLFDYVDRIAIIHLPDRLDRYRALGEELLRAGIEIDNPKIMFPAPPMPDDANGFHSRGVHGNFLSHLEIIESAYHDGLETLLVLEDDAIFSDRFRATQSNLVDALSSDAWDMCFVGHSISTGLQDSTSGLVRYSGPFIWAHCYLLHRRVMPRLIQYMRDTLLHPAGHPDGGRMYIDATFTLFRKRYPDMICLISSPCLSVQRGSQSSLNSQLWYDKSSITRYAVRGARVIRDELWRKGWLPQK
ncbi:MULTISPECIES: glycosyltransferase family 25 protein [Bradyrhizobium]|uniref:Glycosyltransferase involved in LPS biosynthesis, GR25 family n=2 Tax=Bradyrhizobium TaxID=374 RepID=A0ABY0Q754_9BRAD|nr:MULTISPECIES: glycosyltransferase family 25 protein [Bradyrhizobium]SDJ63685.1 Glycosyltransferase involved in LPS biosynthesis, GR25 family [Bradyrhizobium ottawaense]SEC33017.1 Glycosyltransferase involved in LPS biosynthesis, GR25 family [Bradyrhizobium lablabi]